MNAPGRSRNRYGFGHSMAELMMTMAVAGILLAAAAPSLVSMVQDKRVATRIDLLLSDLQLARLEAIKRNEDVVLCRSEDGRQCSPSSGHRADWSMGWIVYVNTDEDKIRDPDEPLLQVRTALHRGLRLEFNQWWRLIYHADGSAKNGTFTLCDSRGPAHARALTVYYTGRPRTADTQPGGEPLDCD